MRASSGNCWSLMFPKNCVWVTAVIHFPHRLYIPLGNKITQERPVLFLQKRNSTFIVIIYLEAFQSD